MPQEFEALKIERAGAAATVHMMWPDGSIGQFRQFHSEFPVALQMLRDDDNVRVVVLRGCGDRFLTAVGRERPDPLGAILRTPTGRSGRPRKFSTPSSAWKSR
jgi:hypothetical protein